MQILRCFCPQWQINNFSALLIGDMLFFYVLREPKWCRFLRFFFHFSDWLTIFFTLLIGEMLFFLCLEEAKVMRILRCFCFQWLVIKIFTLLVEDMLRNALETRPGICAAFEDSLGGVTWFFDSFWSCWQINKTFALSLGEIVLRIRLAICVDFENRLGEFTRFLFSLSDLTNRLTRLLHHHWEKYS